MLRAVLVLPCLLLASLPAQAMLLATSAGIAVHAGTTSAPPSLPGADLGAGCSLLAVGATTQAAFTAVHTVGSAAVTLRLDAGADAIWTGAADFDGSIDYDLFAPAPVAGTLAITCSLQASGTGTGRATVDVGGDGSLEADNAAATLPVHLGPGGLRVRVRQQGSAQAFVLRGPFGSSIPVTGHVQLGLQVVFTPLPASCQEVLPTCGGPELQATSNWRRGLDLLVANGNTPADLQVLVFGTEAQGTVLPLPPGCTLATTPIATLMLWPDAAGNATVSLDGQRAPRPFTLVAQALGADLAAWQLRSSRALRIGLP